MMCKRKISRGLAASFSITIAIIATLFCDIVASAFIIFPPSHRLIGYEGNYPLEVLTGLGGNFIIASVLSAMLFFFTHKKLLSRCFHTTVLIIVATLTAVPPVLILILSALGDYNSSIYEISFIFALVVYVSPIICEYIFARKKYSNPK